MTTVLDEPLLADFERALRSVGAVITDVWAPGLTDAEIDGLVRPFGFDLPGEARVWWRWHNGVVPEARPVQRDLTPRRPLLDLATVLESFREHRATALELDGIDCLLQPLSDQPWIFFACAGARGEPVPIYVGGHGEDVELVLPSIGELVATWTELIDRRSFMTDSDGRWEWDFEKIPPEVVRLGIY